MLHGKTRTALPPRRTFPDSSFLPAPKHVPYQSKKNFQEPVASTLFSGFPPGRSVPFRPPGSTPIRLSMPSPGSRPKILNNSINYNRFQGALKSARAAKRKAERRMERQSAVPPDLTAPVSGFRLRPRGSSRLEKLQPDTGLSASPLLVNTSFL